MPRRPPLASPPLPALAAAGPRRPLLCYRRPLLVLFPAALPRPAEPLRSSIPPSPSGPRRHFVGGGSGPGPGPGEKRPGSAAVPGNDPGELLRSWK